MCHILITEKKIGAEVENFKRNHDSYLRGFSLMIEGFMIIMKSLCKIVITNNDILKFY